MRVRRAIMRGAAMLVGVAFLCAVAVSSVLAYPQPLFSYHLEYGRLQLWSDPRRGRRLRRVRRRGGYRGAHLRARRRRRDLDPARSGLYARYRLLVAWMLEREGWSIDRLLAANLTQDEAEARLLEGRRRKQ